MMSNAERQVLLFAAGVRHHIKNNNKFEASIWTSDLVGNLLELPSNLIQNFCLFNHSLPFVFFFLFGAIFAFDCQIRWYSVVESSVYDYERSYVICQLNTVHSIDGTRRETEAASIVCGSNLANLWYQITAKLSYM